MYEKMIIHFISENQFMRNHPYHLRLRSSDILDIILYTRNVRLDDSDDPRYKP